LAIRGLFIGLTRHGPFIPVRLENNVNGIWMLLLLITPLVIPFFYAKFQPSDLKEELDASFAEQRVTVDGMDVSAKELEVLHRQFGSFSRGRVEDMSVMETSVPG
jgi:hypothetical protein